MVRIVLYRELCGAPHSSFLMPSHVLRVVSYVLQSLEENRDVLSVNSPLTVCSGLIFSSILAGKGGMNVFSFLSVMFERERERFHNLSFDLLQFILPKSTICDSHLVGIFKKI